MNQNNPGAMADDAQNPESDILPGQTKPKPVASAPGTIPNVGTIAPSAPNTDPSIGGLPALSAPPGIAAGGTMANTQAPASPTSFAPGDVAAWSSSFADPNGDTSQVTPQQWDAVNQYRAGQAAQDAASQQSNANFWQNQQAQDARDKAEAEQANQRAQLGLTYTPTSGPGSGTIANNWNGAYDPNQTYAAPAANPNDLAAQGRAAAIAPLAPAPAGGGATRSLTPPAPNVGGTPANLPALALAAPSPTTTGTAGMGNVAQSATTPANALTNQTLSRAPGADRMALANQAITDWNAASQPAFEADLRDAARQAAGRGQIGSGMLRTRLGDLTANRDLQRNAIQNQFRRDAQTGSIEDAFRDVGVAQQQQGFQSGQQQTAFQQALQQALGENQLTDSDFQRALQAATFGYGGNPSQTQLALSGTYGTQATGAGNAAGAYGQASAGRGGNNAYLDALMQALGYGKAGSAVPPGTMLPSGLPNG